MMSLLPLFLGYKATKAFKIAMWLLRILVDVSEKFQKTIGKYGAPEIETLIVYRVFSLFD